MFLVQSPDAIVFHSTLLHGFQSVLNLHQFSRGRKGSERETVSFRHGRAEVSPKYDYQYLKWFEIMKEWKSKIMNTLTIDWKNTLRQKTRTEIGVDKAKALIRRLKYKCRRTKADAIAHGEATTLLSSFMTDLVLSISTSRVTDNTLEGMSVMTRKKPHP